MTLRIELRAPALSDECQRAFTQDVRLAFHFYALIRHRRGLPASRLTAILADDFVGEVNSQMPAESRFTEGPDFSTGRAGGVVVAKTMAQTPDWAEVVAIFDSQHYAHIDNPAQRLCAISTVAHELAHVVIGRASFVSGALAKVTQQPFTGSEVARYVTRVAYDEYRADVLSGIFVSAFVTADQDDGKRVPASVWMVQAGSRMATLVEVISGAYPTWPDIVQGYREGRMSLVEMIRDINTHVVQTITTLVHTQAEAMESLEVIDDKAIASLPATLLYLGDPWRSLIAAFRREHPLPSLRLTAETEERVLTAGQTAIFGIWNALGWTIREWPVRQWEVIVGDPKRLV